MLRIAEIPRHSHCHCISTLGDIKQACYACIISCYVVVMSLCRDISEISEITEMPRHSHCCYVSTPCNI